MTIYILILHFGDSKTTDSCLRSVVKMAKKHFDVKILVIDNDPDNRYHPYLRQADIMQNDTNLGFAAGMNKGIRKALNNKSTDNIMLLNNDTILPKDFLQVLLKTGKDITASVVKFKSKKGKWVYDYGGKVNWLTGRTKHLESNRYPTNEFKNQSVDYVSGCCLLVKRQVFDKIGQLDERFFFYFEDVDFCLRAKKAGFDIKVADGTTVVHKLSGTIGRWSNKAIFFNLRSNFMFVNKHFGWRKPIAWGYLALLSVKIIIDKLINTHD